VNCDVNLCDVTHTAKNLNKFFFMLSDVNLLILKLLPIGDHGIMPIFDSFSCNLVIEL
jgi:hypothetical protein